MTKEGGCASDGTKCRLQGGKAMEKPTIADELVKLAKGLYPIVIGMMFAFCIIFCVIEQIDIPDWFKAMLTTGTGTGIGAAVVSRKASK